MDTIHIASVRDKDGQLVGGASYTFGDGGCNSLWTTGLLAALCMKPKTTVPLKVMSLIEDALERIFFVCHYSHRYCISILFLYCFLWGCSSAIVCIDLKFSNSRVHHGPSVIMHNQNSSKIVQNSWKELYSTAVTTRNYDRALESKWMQYGLRNYQRTLRHPMEVLLALTNLVWYS